MRRHKATNLHPSQRIVEAISGTYDPPGDIPLVRRVDVPPHVHVLANYPTYPNAPRIMYGVTHVNHYFDLQEDINNLSMWVKTGTDGLIDADAEISYDGKGGSHLRLSAEPTGSRYEVQSTLPTATITPNTTTWLHGIVQLDANANLIFGIYEHGNANDFYKAGFGFTSSYNAETDQHTIIAIYQNGEDWVWVNSDSPTVIDSGELIGLALRYTADTVTYHISHETTGFLAGIAWDVTHGDPELFKDLDVHTTVGVIAGGDPTASVRFYGVRVIDEKVIIDPKSRI